MSATAQLFGTDGIRGLANLDLSAESMTSLGRAVGRFVQPDSHVIVGRDTRRSGPMMEAALVAGLCSAGAVPVLVGVMPTPAVGYLTRLRRASAGVIVTASHNPGSYNGLKLFDGEGMKFTHAAQQAIESMLSEPANALEREAVGMPERPQGGCETYIRHVCGSIEESLTGLRIVLDARGTAATSAAPGAFARSGAHVEMLEPLVQDGSGAAGDGAVERLAHRVRRSRADIGVAFDGDADRLVLIDEQGRSHDGNCLLAVLAVHRFKAQLSSVPLVTTDAGNKGLLRACAEHDIEVLLTTIGDRAVSTAMRETGSVLGGEWSGHVTIAPTSRTSDGLLTALHVASTLASTGRPLSELARVYTPLAEVLINVPVSRRVPFELDPRLTPLIDEAVAELGEEGAVRVWASGTEPMVRVKVQALDAWRARQIAASLADAVAQPDRTSGSISSR